MAGLGQTTTLLQKDLDARGQLLAAEERERIFTSLGPRARSQNDDGHVASHLSSTSLREKPIREFLARCVHTLLYNLIHTFYSFLSILRLAYAIIVQRILAMRHRHHRTPAVIQRDIGKLSKVPRHLSIILDGSGAAQDGAAMVKLMNDVCECAAWAACAGIQVLSIYERHGKINLVRLPVVR